MKKFIELALEVIENLDSYEVSEYETLKVNMDAANIERIFNLVLRGCTGHDRCRTAAGGKAPENRHRRGAGSGLGAPEERGRGRRAGPAGHGRQLCV